MRTNPWGRWSSSCSCGRLPDEKLLGSAGARGAGSSRELGSPRVPQSCCPSEDGGQSRSPGALGAHFPRPPLPPPGSATARVSAGIFSSFSPFSATLGRPLCRSPSAQVPVATPCATTDSWGGLGCPHHWGGQSLQFCSHSEPSALL